MQHKIIYSLLENSSGNYNIILDRDGVINLNTGYAYVFEKMKINISLMNLLSKKRNKILSLHIATNQSGIARGYFTGQEFIENSQKLHDYLKLSNISLNSIYYCPHLPIDMCDCRKPNNGMLEAIIDDFSLTRSKTIFIGDAPSDKEAAMRSNIKFRKSEYHE